MTSRFVLHCTAKLLRELPTEVVEPDPGMTDPDASWCLNLVRIERRKCLLAMHEETRFAIFVPNLARADLKRLPQLFVTAVGEVLATQGIRRANTLDQAAAVITRADIRHRSVLSCMNETAFECRLFIDNQGGLAKCDMNALHRAMNDTLHKGKDGQYKTAMQRVAKREGAWP